MSISEHWQQQFDRFITNHVQPTWLNDLRRQAFHRWQATGFPTLRNERWKYTELMPLSQTEFTLPQPQNNAYQHLLPELIDNSLRLVFVDGQLQADISNLNTSSLQVKTIAEILSTDPTPLRDYFNTAQILDGITDLNTALTENGVVINIPADKILTTPLHVIYLYTQMTNNMVHFKNIIHLEKNAVATVIEHHIGQDGIRYFATALNHIKLDNNSKLTFYRWQEQGSDGYHINRTNLHQAARSQFNLFSFDVKGHLVRNELLQEFTGEHAVCDLAGLYVGSGKQHIDNYISLNHALPHCRSIQLFKGILDERAHGVFHGKVIVHKDAQKTDAKQHNANLILSNKAEIDTQPQLEIYADDVKCTHGAAIGQLDEEALFYLQSRGLSIELAKQILMYGFAADILQRIEQTEMRAFCQTRMRHYFSDMPLMQDEKND